MWLPTSHYVESFVELPASAITWFCLCKWMLGLQCFWQGTVITHTGSVEQFGFLFFFPEMLQRASELKALALIKHDTSEKQNRLIRTPLISSLAHFMSSWSCQVWFILKAAIVSWLSPQRSVFCFAPWWERLPPQLLVLPGDCSTLQGCFITRTSQECIRPVEVCTGVCSGHCCD